MRGLGLGPRKLGWHGLDHGLGTVSLGWHGSGSGEGSMDLTTAVVPMMGVVKAPWTSPRVATEVATTVVPMVETRGDDAAPLIVAFCLTDLRNPIS
ncbi:hypothetical protein ACFX1X_038151 [Malus domestica]